MKENNTPLKATELRIGNFVLLTKDDFKTTKVYELSGVDIYKVDESDCADIRPIPLTEDWLIKFGFERTEFMGYETYILNQELHDMGGIGFATQEALISVENSSFMLCLGVRDIEIKYVHVLQNSIFYLTNTELTIK